MVVLAASKAVAWAVHAAGSLEGALEATTARRRAAAEPASS
tara:strand:- start:291 stop:413 length:123 start_codon:yes stop_codon:yes gene_type:complete